MKLYVMRHGAADEAASSLHDFDRALTMKGRKRSRSVAKALVEHDERPELIVASPLVRAVQTAEIVAAVIEPDEPVAIRQELGPGGDLYALVREYVARGLHSVMLVGHEPSASHVVGEILADGKLHKPLQKSMIVALKVDAGGRGKCRFVLDPKSLAFGGDEMVVTQD